MSSFNQDTSAKYRCGGGESQRQPHTVTNSSEKSCPLGGAVFRFCQIAGLSSCHIQWRYQ